MNTRWFVRVLLMTCWVPLVLAVLAVGLEAMTITGKSSQYIAIGKLFIEPGKAVADSPQGRDPYGEITMQIAEGGDVKRRTLDRVRALHPELPELDVDLSVSSRDKKTSIVRVVAVSWEQKYTKVFLDAWLDEFMTCQEETMEREAGVRTNKGIQEVLSRERVMKQEEQSLASFELEHDPLVMAADRERLAKSVSARRGEVEDLEGAAAGEEKLKAAREALADAEKKFAELTRLQKTLDQMKEQYQVHKEDYDQWKKRLDDLTAEMKLWQPKVVIMERPVTALEDAPDLVTPITFAAFAGAGGGLVLIFTLSTLVAFAKRHKVQPPPLKTQQPT